MSKYIDWWAYRVWLNLEAPRLAPSARWVAVDQGIVGSPARRAAWVIEPAPVDLRWRDPLSGTWFCLRAKDAAAITKAGLRTLSGLVGRGPGAVVAYLNGPGLSDIARDEETLRSRLLPELPAAALTGTSGRELPVAARLADVATVRTAFLNALLAGELAAELAGRRRIAALVADLGRYLPSAEVPGRDPSLEATPAFKLADAIANGQSETSPGAVVSGLPLDQTIGLVYGGSVKIKEYLFESNQLPAIRGASILLDEINHGRIPGAFAGISGALLPQGLIPEAIVMAGGGNILAVVPPDLATQAARFIETVHERVTLTAQAVAVAHCVPARAFIAGGGGAEATQGILSELSTLQAARQGVKLPLWLPEFSGQPDEVHSTDINYAAVPGTEYTEPHAIRIHAPKVCDRCRQRMAMFELPRPEGSEALCRPCLNRAHAGRATRNRLAQDLTDYAKARDLTLTGRQPQSVKDIAAGDVDSGGRGMVAVVYGDGNDMGKVVRGLSTFPTLRLFGQRMETIVSDAVFAATVHVSRRREVEFLLLGGDDLFFLMPSATAVSTARALVQVFDLSFLNLSTHVPVATMSVGVAMGHDQSPIANVVEVARQLLKSAKANAKCRSVAIGTLDFAALEAFDTFTDSPRAYFEATYRRTTDGPQGSRRLELSLRPYDRDTVARLTDLIGVLARNRDSRGRSLLYALRTAAMTLEPEEANLFCDYQFARLGVNDTDSLRQSLANLRASVNGNQTAGAEETALKVFWRADDALGERWISPWIDVIDLWEYAKGGDR